MLLTIHLLKEAFQISVTFIKTKVWVHNFDLLQALFLCGSSDPAKFAQKSPRTTNTRSSSTHSCRLKVCLHPSVVAGSKILIPHHLLLVCFISLSLSAVYNLLTSPDCLPDLLQGGLAEQGVNEAFILTTFKLQPKTGTTLFGLFNPRDNSKYFEFTVMGKLNRGK